MDKTILLEIFQASFDSLYNSEMIPQKVIVSDDTTIIGADSVLDSIGFITLFSELEDRISEKINNEVFLVLGDIHEFNQDKNKLTIGILIKYIQSII